jgi:hypothetical protein
MTDTLKIEQYDIVSFCQDMFNAFKQGYEPVWTSEDSPQQIGFGFHAILHKTKCSPVVVGELVLEASIDTAKLQEQLKTGGEVEQMITDSLVVGEKTGGVHETFIDGQIEPPLPEPTIDEALPKEEQELLQTKTTPTKRGRK